MLPLLFVLLLHNLKKQTKKRNIFPLFSQSQTDDIFFILFSVFLFIYHNFKKIKVSLLLYVHLVFS